MLETDVAICGAGIVGLATARALLDKEPHLSLLLLDKEPHLAAHQTGHNSGVLHTGLYYRPGSRKAHTCTRGRRLMVDFCEVEGIAHDLCGKVVVATDETELPGLERLRKRAEKNSITTESLSSQELGRREPHVRGLRALYVPEAGVVDYRAVSQRLALRLVEQGAKLFLETEVMSLRDGRDGVVVETSQGPLKAKHFINAAGLQSDRVFRMSCAKPPARHIQIVPFRGEYYSLTDDASFLVKALIYPVPDPTFPFLGIHFTRGISGEVECGPNAILNLGRETYDKWSLEPGDLTETLLFPGFLRLALRHGRAGLMELHRSLSPSAFLNAAQRLVPQLRREHLRRAPAGIRAQAVDETGQLLDDFHFEQGPFVSHVLNAPSPAATASLAIGEEIAGRVLARLS